MTWADKTPAQIIHDLNALLMDASTPADLIIMPRDTWVHWRAMQIFGQRVNRANRHKFRRVKLAVLSGATWVQPTPPSSS